MLIVPYTFGPPLWSVAWPFGPRLLLYRRSEWRGIGQKVDWGGRDSRGPTVTRRSCARPLRPTIRWWLLRYTEAEICQLPRLRNAGPFQAVTVSPLNNQSWSGSISSFGPAT